MDGFALLDDRSANARQPASRLYTGFILEHRCTDPAELDAVWARVEAEQAQGAHAVLLADYEWGARLIGAGCAAIAADASPALRVLLYRDLERLDAQQADAWLAERDAQRPAAASGLMHLEPSVDRAEFTHAIGRIHEWIAAGETYQVNYTYRLLGQAYGSPVALYRALRARQPVAYGALIALPGDDWVLSFSPELFLRHQAGVVTARPMKGTASRFAQPEGDSETARLLGLDVKNRAENLMIVDLLRNDLGRIARIGSVTVPELFAIEPYATVFQMTSTIRAELRPEVDFPQLLRAAFPCGSITGAPKHHTMDLIAAVESSPRGLYCGAIGWIDAPPPGQRIGDFCCSVAIRTLTLAPEQHGMRAARLGVGAGIVQDSRADDEFEECRLKARFLTGLDPGFELFETMHATRASVRHVERHLARLSASAQALGFPFDRLLAEQQIARAQSELPADVPCRLRLALGHSGRFATTHAVLGALPDEPVRLLIAAERLAIDNPLAAHKTSLRQAYDAGVRAAEAAGAFDSLFFTTDGRLAEGGRSSVFARLDGRWFTPPVADGALPGVMRAVLLEDPAWAAAERSLSLADLRRAEAIVVCNALRGALPARLDEGGPPA